MVSMKTMMVVLMTILFSLLFISQLSNAETYKWVDEKGTVHFTDDPATVPEKYRDKANSRTTEEDLMTPEEKIRAKQKYEKEIREKLKQEKREEEVKRLQEQLKTINKSIKESMESAQETSSRPSVEPYVKGSPGAGKKYIQKWYGPDGYIELKDGTLYTPKGIYYPSSKNKWFGPSGYITLSGRNLFTPDGTIYYPSN